MEETLSKLESLDWDTATIIIRYLDEPADLVRLAATSQSCQKLVFKSKCTKNLCIRFSSEVSIFNSVVQEDKMSIHPSSSKDSEWENLKTEHRVYAMLANELIGPPVDRSCICEAICATSTDNDPDESIINTLSPKPTYADRPCYWSSVGERNKDVPEALTYELVTNLCVVHEVKIHPFQAYFQRGAPIYSANAVRFQFGYPRSLHGSNISPVDSFATSGQSSSESYVWTYVSPEYPMQQKDTLQTFKLPRPVLCIGGILQVQLLGRIQQQEIDALYYICVCHVHVVGRLLPLFKYEVSAQPRQFILKHLEKQKTLGMLSEDTSRVDSEGDVIGTSSDPLPLAKRIRLER